MIWDHLRTVCIQLNQIYRTMGYKSHEVCGRLINLRKIFIFRLTFWTRRLFGGVLLLLECRVIKPSKESLGKLAWLDKNCAAVGSLKSGQFENNEFWGEKLL